MHIASNKDVKRSGLYPHVTRHTSSHCKHTAAHHRCITVSHSRRSVMLDFTLRTMMPDARRHVAIQDDENGCPANIRQAANVGTHDTHTNLRAHKDST